MWLEPITLLPWRTGYETGTYGTTFSFLLSYMIFSFPIYLLASQSCKIFNIAMSYAWSEMLIKLWPSLIWACQVMCQVLRLLIRWCCDQTFLWQWANPQNGRDAGFAALLFLSFSPFSSPSLPYSFLPFSFLIFCIFFSSYWKQTWFWNSSNFHRTSKLLKFPWIWGG